MKILGFLKPSPTLSESDIRRSQFLMRWDGVLAGAMFSLGSGGFMAAYALALGANNLQVGILAALPTASQMVRLPSVLLIEKFRVRKAIAVPAWFLGQLMWLPIGAVPFLLDTPGAAAVAVVIVALALRGVFASVYTTAVHGWMRDLIPQDMLGRMFSNRLMQMTVAMAILGLGGSFFVRWWQGYATPDHSIYAYSFLLVGGWAVMGVTGPVLLAMTKEPLMPASRELQRSAVSVLMEPLRDANFARLFRFLFVWNFALNMAVPFFAVYMLKRLEFSLPVVMAFTVLSQFTNVLFVRVWGAMADRVSSKTVMSLSASLFLLVIIGWVFTTNPDRYFLTVPLLTALHIFAGVAAAGVLLTTQTLALKTAPEGKATSYVGMAGVATGLGAGFSPMIGGALADFFSVRVFRIDLSWSSPNGLFNLPAISLTGYDFLFVIAFALGLLALNLLTALREEGEVSKDVALGELTAGLTQAMRPVSSVPGLGVITAASYGYLRRVPGADVALGVLAYQLASSTRSAVSSAARGRDLAQEVQNRVGAALDETVDRMENVREHGLELARHATRGAILAGSELEGQAARVARAAAMGAIRTLDRTSVQTLDVLHGVGYGVVQGSLESGRDPGEAAAAVVEAAREAATELGITEREATEAAAAGILSAAADAGQQALTDVRRAIPEELSDADSRNRPPEGDEGA